MLSLQEIYDLAIQTGIEADPRGEKKVKKQLETINKEYKDLSEKRKKFFDEVSLTNPYSDSRILSGEPKVKVEKVMVGIDAAEAELLLLDRLNQKGEKIDLLISHHPLGYALAGLNEVMDIQIDMFADEGVPENVAHALFEDRKQSVKRRFAPLNHTRSLDIAKLLNIPFMVIHTPWDSLACTYMKDYLTKKSFENVGEIVDYINELPEFAEASKGKAGPVIVAGSDKRRPGKIHVGFTGGTSPSKELYVELAKAGVGTVVEMHVSDDVIDELKKLHINVIAVGHMAADSLGANLFLDELEKRNIEVIPCSGLIRVSRNKKR